MAVPLPPQFHVAVDVVALTIQDDLLKVAVVQRTASTSCIRQPDGAVREIPRRAEHFALPGGHVGPKEGLIDAALRELAEETGLAVAAGDLIQIGAFGDPTRDPRSGRTVSVAYAAFSPSLPDPRGGSDARYARFIDVVEVLAAPNQLEFDHATILRQAIGTVRDVIERTPLALNFCDERFTMGDLRRVYEILFAPAYDADAPVDRVAAELRDAHSGWMPPPDTSITRSMRLMSGANAPAPMSMGMDAPMSMEEDTGTPTGLQRRSSRSTSSRSSREELSPTFRLTLDPGNFARKVLAIDGFVRRHRISGGDVDSTPSRSGPGRPPQHFVRGNATRLDPPLIVRRRDG